MLTGIVNQDSLPQLLQSIAQRRKQGDLEITLKEKTVKVSFIQGRIVEFWDGDVVPALEVARYLNATRLVVPPLTAFAGASYGDLQTFLQTAAPEFTNEQLRAAIRDRLLNKVHALAIESTVPWGFRVGGIDVDRSMVTGISVSQLQLDWAELAQNTDELRKHVEETQVIAKVAGFSGEIDGEAEMVIRYLDTPRSLQALREEVPLTALALTAAVLRLFTLGAIAANMGATSVAVSNEETAQASDITAPETPQSRAAEEVAENYQRPQKTKLKPKRETSIETISHLVALIILLSAVVTPFLFWVDAFTLF